MRVIFAANRCVPLPVIANHLVTQLAMLPMEVTVLLRAPKNDPPQAFEKLVADLCQSVDITVEWFRPETRGREATFDRDWRIVRAADRMVAYLSHQTPADAGTHHLIECGISEEVETTVYLAGTEAEQTLAWVGGT